MPTRAARLDEADARAAGRPTRAAPKSTRAGAPRCRRSSATRRSASSRSRACSTKRSRPSPTARKVLSGKAGGGRAVRHRDRRGLRRRPGGEGDRTQERPGPHPPAAGELFEHHDYRKFAEVHAALLKQVGRPPFEVRFGGRSSEALSFQALRGAVLELARHGVQLTRFKGLGEMNADQLRETTMDPATPHPGPGHPRRRNRGGSDLLDADGRPGGPSARLHRVEREGRQVPRCLHGPRARGSELRWRSRP